MKLFQKTPLIIFAFTANSVPFFLPPDPLVSHAKIIFPKIIVNIDINPCLTVYVCLPSSLLFHKTKYLITHMSRLCQTLREGFVKDFCNEENTANEFEG